MSTTMPVKLPSLSTEITFDPKWVEQKAQILERAGRITTVESQVDYDEAEVSLTRLTKTSNAMETYRKEVSEPFLEAQRIIKRVGDDARADLEAEKVRIKALMTAFYVEQKRLRQIEEEQIAAARAKEIEEAAKGDDPFAEQVVMQKPVQVAPTPTVQRAMSAVVESWDFEITNPNNVPREYCAPNESIIRSAIKKGGIRSIPGVRIFETTNVRSR